MMLEGEGVVEGSGQRRERGKDMKRRGRKRACAHV